jgi:hypothetical protein
MEQIVVRHDPVRRGEEGRISLRLRRRLDPSSPFSPRLKFRRVSASDFRR